MLTDTLHSPLRQVLRKLCMIKPPQSREPLQATAVPRCCSETRPHSNYHIFELTPLIKVFLSILKSSHHGLCIAHGLALMTPSLRGWEAFQCPEPSPTLGSFGPSHQQHHKLRMSLPGPPWVHGVLGIPYREVHDSFSLFFCSELDPCLSCLVRMFFKIYYLIFFQCCCLKIVVL